MKSILKRLKLRQDIYRPLGFIITFAVVGIVVIIFAYASSNHVSIEPEDGRLSGNASINNDTNASGGKAIQFGGDGLLGTSKYMTGVTLTQDTSNTYTNLLGNSSALANQHLYTFGVFSPIKSLTVDSAAGTYNLVMNWSSADKRYGTSTTPGLLSTYPGQVVLTACCTMSQLQDPADAGQSPNSTSVRWVWLPSNASHDPNDDQEYADPSRQIYYKIYADIVYQTVKRYPNIKYVQVWNEMKGYYDSKFNAVGDSNSNHNGGENYKKYTVLYNLIWDKLHSDNATKSVKIGGPYIVTRSYSISNNNWFEWQGKPGSLCNTDTNSWHSCIDIRSLDGIKYWWRNKRGADFITLDIKNNNSCQDPNIPSGCSVDEQTNPFKRMDKYQAVADWVRQNISSIMPLWWAEWYARLNPIIQDSKVTDVALNDPTNKAYQGTIAQRNALMSAALIKFVKAGVSTGLMWGAEGLDYIGPPANLTGIYHPLALYDSTLTATPFYNSQKCIKDHFSSGVSYYDPGNTNSNVEVLASRTWIMAVNKTGSQQTATVYGKSLTLNSGYQVVCQQTN